MNRPQHTTVGIGMGVGSSLVAFAATRDIFSLASFFGSFFGCTFPDWDHDLTKEGKVRKQVFQLTGKLLTVIAVLGTAFLAYAIIKMPDLIERYNISTDRAMLYLMVCVVFLLAKKVLSNNKLVKWACKHRGLMHTLIVPLLLGIGIFTLKIPFIGYLLYGTLTGFCSHLIADCFTTEGCPLLFPLTRKNIRVPGFNYASKDPKLYTVSKVLAVLFGLGGLVIAKFIFDTGYVLPIF